MIRRVELIAGRINVFICLPLFICCIVTACGAESEALRLNNEGVELLSRGELQLAIARLEAAHRIDRKNQTVATNLSSTYLRQAENLIGAGEFKKAIYWLDEALSVGVEDSVIKNNLSATYNEIANVYVGDGQYAEAISLLESAVNLKPGSAVLRCNLGIVLFRNNRLRDALDEFRGVLDSTPDNVTARKMSGIILYRRGEMKEAIQELKIAAKLDPADEEVKSYLEKAEKEYEVEKDFDVDKYVHFTVSFDGRKDYRVGRVVIDALEEAWLQVGSDFNFYPREKIAVVIYSGRQFRDLLNKPKNVGGLYDGKIRVPVGGLDSDRDRDKLRKVLLHEYAHVVVHLLTHNRCPLWFNEGIAEYESDSWTESKREMIVRAIEGDRFIPISQLSAALKNVTSSRVGLAYCESFSIVRFIADRYGVYNLRRILDRLDAGDDMNEALSKVISINLEGLGKEWVKSLQ